MGISFLLLLNELKMKGIRICISFFIHEQLEKCDNTHRKMYYLSFIE